MPETAEPPAPPKETTPPAKSPSKEAPAPAPPEDKKPTKASWGDEIDGLLAGETTKEDKPAAKNAEKNGKPEKEEESDEAPEPDAPPTGRITKQFREHYKTTKQERDALKLELETYKKAPKEDPDKAAVTDKLTKEEKRRQELEEEIKHLNYERSDEYKEKYKIPLEKAYSRAYKEIKEYTIVEPNGNERQATPDDFTKVVWLAPGDVVAKTKEWFGDAAPEIRALRRKVLELHAEGEEAVKEYKEKGVEREKSRTAEQAQMREKANQLWEQSNKEAIEKYPQWFAPKEGDEEANKLLESGYRLADLHFEPPKDLSLEKRVGLASQVRHRIAGFARVVLENKRLSEKLKTLETELKEFRESEPGKSDGSREVKTGPKTFEQEIDELAGKK